MQYRRLGKTDIDVSAVALGTWAFVGDATWGEQDERDSIATIEAALDVGVTFFDTAEAYGDGYSESLLGKTLAGRRDHVTIGSKVAENHLAKNDLLGACEASLSRLRTDYIDLYQVHWPSRSIPVEEVWEALELLKKQGKIRAVGVSNFGARDLADFLPGRRCETDQLAYNLLFRAIEFEAVPACLDHGLSILCYSPLCQGLLTGKFASPDEVPEGRARTRLFSSARPMSRHHEQGCEQEMFEAIERIRVICRQLDAPMPAVSLAWLLSRPAVASVLAGARRPEQVRQNAQAAELTLSPSVISDLDSATDKLKAMIGPNADLWQTDSRLR